MIQQGAAIDASAVELRGIDVETLGVGEMTASLKGADGLVIAVGFVPGNPFKMTAAANAVDNVGTVKLIDAAKVSPDPPPTPSQAIMIHCYSEQDHIKNHKCHIFRHLNFLLTSEKQNRKNTVF